MDSHWLMDFYHMQHYRELTLSTGERSYKNKQWATITLVTDEVVILFLSLTQNYENCFMAAENERMFYEY